MNLRAQIRRDLEKTIDNLPSFAKASPGEQLTIDKRQIEVTRTSSGRFGDYSTNVALKITSSVILEGSGDSRRPIGSKTSSKRDSIASLASLRGRSGLQNDKGYRIIKQSPIEIARILADSLKNLLYIEKLEVAPPGFINFFIKPEIWQEQVEIVLKAGSGFGSSSLGKGKKARVEFVSANPTGPLHFGNARGGPIGDVLANVLQFCGYDVLREYYHNDIGEQVRKLGESIVNVSNGQRVEEQEYKGEYVRELAKKIFAGPVSRFLPASARSKLKSKGDQQNNVELRAVGNPPTTATPKNLTAAGSKSENEPGLQRNSKPGSGDVDAADAGKKAVQILFKEIMADCAAMGIEFDKFYSESELANTVTQKVLDALKTKGVLKKQEGATWFAPNDQFLKDRESVVVKSDGSYTYFANDIAYHNLKFENSPDLVVDVWGANHHGHVPRIKAAIASLGHETSKFHVILYQWVRFKRGSEIVKMSKRSGTFITAREVLDEIGPDALRFFILMYDPNSHIDFDLDLAKERSNKNPVYYVQYAHARIASILTKVPNVNLESRTPVILERSDRISKKRSYRSFHSLQDDNANYQLLTTNYELSLIKQITRLPELVEDIASNFAVHRLTAYSIDLADSFHKFYENCPVLSDDKELTEARIALISATKIALANTLRLLGVSAPQKM